MTRTERIDATDIRFRRQGSGDRALVFVHGFLDDQYVWDGVISELTTSGFESVQLDLAGCGYRTESEGPFTYDRFATEVGNVVDALGKPCVLVGQSMGACIAELVAASRVPQVLGLVLLTPAPLAGTRLPDDAIEQFRSLGGQPEAQRRLRQQFSVALPEAELDRLVVTGSRVHEDVVRDLADCWNTGHADGNRPSRYTGPTLVIRGAGDRFITEALVAATVLPRFQSVDTLEIKNAGHWAHVESPKDVAARIDSFLATLTTAVSTRDATSNGASQAWQGAFASKSAEDFGQTFAENVILEASDMTRPVNGREQVKAVMGTASGMYESLIFTRDASSGPRSYLEWEATAFGGMTMSGITILTKNRHGQIERAVIHRRPLGAVVRFSEELRKRLDGVLDPSFFYIQS